MWMCSSLIHYHRLIYQPLSRRDYLFFSPCVSQKSCSLSLKYISNGHRYHCKYFYKVPAQLSQCGDWLQAAQLGASRTALKSTHLLSNGHQGKAAKA